MRLGVSDEAKEYVRFTAINSIHLRVYIEVNRGQSWLGWGTSTCCQVYTKGWSLHIVPRGARMVGPSLEHQQVHQGAETSFWPGMRMCNLSGG